MDFLLFFSFFFLNKSVNRTGPHIRACTSVQQVMFLVITPLANLDLSTHQNVSGLWEEAGVAVRQQFLTGLFLACGWKPGNPESEHASATQRD